MRAPRNAVVKLDLWINDRRKRAGRAPGALGRARVIGLL